MCDDKCCGNVDCKCESKEDLLVPVIKDVQPCGTQILIELLTENEVLGTKLYLASNDKSKNKGAPQGYIVAVGPKINIDEWGFIIGSRVVLTGTYTPVPERKNKVAERESILVEPHQIKAILVE